MLNLINFNKFKLLINNIKFKTNKYLWGDSVTVSTGVLYTR